MRTNISPTVRPYESLHLHSCCELENIRDRLASPWGQTIEIASPSSPPPTGPGPHCLQHHNWTQRKTRPRDGCTELKKGGEGEGKKERGCKREHFSGMTLHLEGWSQGRWSPRIKNKLKRPEKPHPIKVTVDSVFIKKHCSPKFL